MRAYSIKKPGNDILIRIFSAIGNMAGENMNEFFRPPLFEYFKKGIVRKFLLNPDCTLYVVEDGRDIVGFAFVTFLKWDTDIFGFKIGRIEHLTVCAPGSIKSAFLKKIIEDCKKQRYRHIHCRILPADFEILFLLEEMKFNVADIQITFAAEGLAKTKFSRRLPSIVIRRSSRNDLKELKVLTRGVFTDTRFVVDRRYPADGVDKLYYEWIKNSVLDPKQTVFVAEDGKSGSLAGFSICTVDPDSEEALDVRIGSIDLIAVGDEYRGRGIGRSLVEYSLSWFKKNSDKVEIRTQVSNIRAIRTFTKGGFLEIVSGVRLPAGISMHRWF